MNPGIERYRGDSRDKQDDCGVLRVTHRSRSSRRGCGGRACGLRSCWRGLPGGRRPEQGIEGAPQRAKHPASVQSDVGGEEAQRQVGGHEVHRVPQRAHGYAQRRRQARDQEHPRDPHCDHREEQPRVDDEVRPHRRTYLAEEPIDCGHGPVPVQDQVNRQGRNQQHTEPLMDGDSGDRWIHLDCNDRERHHVHAKPLVGLHFRSHPDRATPVVGDGTVAVRSWRMTLLRPLRVCRDDSGGLRSSRGASPGSRRQSLARLWRPRGGAMGVLSFLGVQRSDPALCRQPAGLVRSD